VVCGVSDGVNGIELLVLYFFRSGHSVPTVTFMRSPSSTVGVMGLA
jgi:hypothetical protein